RALAASTPAFIRTIDSFLFWSQVIPAQLAAAPRTSARAGVSTRLACRMARGYLIACRPESERIRGDIHDASALRFGELNVAQDVGNAVLDLRIADSLRPGGDDAAVVVDGEGGVDRAGERRLDDELLLIAVLDLVELLPDVAADGVLVEAA